MVILKLLVAAFLLVAVPIMTGYTLSVLLNKDTKNSLLYGYIGVLSLLELVGIPVVLLCNAHAYLVFCLVFGGVLLVSSIAGVVIRFRIIPLKSIKSGFSDTKLAFRAYSLEEKIYIALILLCILGQLVMVFIYASMDADDFYYNAQALTSQMFGTMYRIDVNTGRSTVLDIRHALALFPMWEAFVSTVSGIHIAILAHKIVPFILIPLSYYLVYRIGGELFGEDHKAQLIFTLLMNIWRVFGFVSYYTTETFFLLRTWQGKSVAGNLILPFIVWIYLRMYREDISKVGAKAHILLALLILASGSSSSLAVLLSCMMTGLVGLLLYIRDRVFIILKYQLLCCLPGVIYILIYIFAN